MLIAHQGYQVCQKSLIVQTARIHSVVFTEQLPILAYQIAKALEIDKQISSIITFIQHGTWPSNKKSFTPLYEWLSELSVMDIWA